MSNRRDNRPKSARGSARSEPRFLVIGQVRKPHGLRGELKVAVYTDEPSRFNQLDTVFLSRRADDANPKSIKLQSVRFQGETALVKFEGYDTPETAGALRKYYLQVAVEDAIPLQEGEYYLYQLLGLAVYTTEGEHIGELTDVIETGANNVFEVKGSRGEILLPDIADVIKTIDFEEKRMTIEPLPGLLGDT